MTLIINYNPTWRYQLRGEEREQYWKEEMKGGGGGGEGLPRHHVSVLVDVLAFPCFHIHPFHAKQISIRDDAVRECERKQVDEK